jgi:hypothetical protein
MNFKSILSLGIILLPAFLSAQTQEISFQYYVATEDYLLDRRAPENPVAVVKTIGDEYISTKQILDAETRKKSKNASMAWAIVYNDETYFHLRYGYDFKVPFFFVKLDVEGRFCLAIMEPSFLKPMDKQRGSYGGGLTGVLMKDSATWGGNYKDNDGNKKKIIFIDTKNLSISIPYNRSHNAAGLLLTRDILKQLIGKDNITKDLSTYTVEEIVEIVENLNHRQMQSSTSLTPGDSP